ncbi:32946_t:CDS:2, partial [Racocetra persica]
RDKVCEIANMNIVTTLHYNVNPDTDLILHDDNNLNEENQIKINTIGEYIATIKATCSYNNYICKRKPIIQYYNILRSENQDKNTSNEEYIIQKTSLKNKIEIMKPFISCDKWHPDKKII